MDFKLIFLDTETASLKGGVCDIAFVELDENLEITRAVESLIDPEIPISPEASGIHHITDDMVKDEPTLAQFMEMHGHPFKTEGTAFGAHNAQFDLRVLAGTLPQVYRKVCTLKLARNLWPELDDHKLQTLRYRFKLDAGTAHRAMGDVVAGVNLLRLICAQQGWSVARLIEESRRPLTLDAKFPFGKHKGTKLKDIPMSYVGWLLNNADNLDPELREALALREN